MNIRQLRTLVATVDMGSFAAAGDLIGLTTSAVSLHIRALERELGVLIFERDNRPLKLNSRGFALVKHARKLIAEFDRTFDVVNDERLSGQLRLGAVPTTLASILPRALKLLRAKHPELNVSIKGSNSGILANSVIQDELDAVILTAPEQIRHGLMWYEVAEEPLVVIAPKGCAGKTYKEVIAKNPFIWFNRNTWAGQHIERHIIEQKIIVSAFMEIDSLDAIKAMVCAGLGVSIVPICTCGTALPDNLRIIPFGEPPFRRTIGVLTKNSPEKEVAVKALVAALKEHAKIHQQTVSVQPAQKR